MVDKIDMSLDEIIKTTKKRGPGGNFRRGRQGTVRRGQNQRNQQRNNSLRGTRQPGGGGRNRRGAVQKPYIRGDVNSAWKHDMFDGFIGGRKGAAQRNLSSGSKLLIGNLDFGVSDSDIQELFAEFGPLKSAAVHYDRSGRSLGTAEVIFERRNDAIKAMKQYNGVPLDGREMNIQLTTSEVPTPRLAGGQRQSAPRRFNNQRRGNQNQRRGGGRNAGGPRQRRDNKPNVTVEELDAELDAYIKETK